MMRRASARRGTHRRRPRRAACRSRGGGGAHQHGKEANAEEGTVLRHAERQEEGLVDDVADDLARDEAKDGQNRTTLERAQQADQQATCDAHAHDCTAVGERRRKDVEQEE